MIIQPDASPDESSSPFFKRNEEFCREFESYITDKKGKVGGKYNAWSYIIKGEISNPKKWTLMYKKATFSSGNLWLSSEKQNLLVLAEWETDRIGTQNSEFNIRRKTIFDFIKLKLFKDLSKLGLNDNYVLQSQMRDSQFILNLTKILAELFSSKEIYRIENKNDKLKIELRSKKHHFEIFDNLSKL